MQVENKEFEKYSMEKMTKTDEIASAHVC